MSPAGGHPQLAAAVEAGADAVYFGLRHFTARAKVGFALAELPNVMATLHRRGVKGYVAFNALVFEHELSGAARAVAKVAEASADAIIVQDVAVAKISREIAPELPVHASTQMSITSVGGVRVAESLGVSRVILARELSLEDVRAIREATNCELEIFVHGALCVSYSGQCLSSEAWGGRSANRGLCAQACRLPYELLVDGEQRPLGDARYLLSPGDLNTLRRVPEIVRLGIQGLKIEGRYKDEQYVALATRAYRRAVDAAFGAGAAPSPREELDLEQVYSRGSGPFFLAGVDHQAVVSGRSPRHRGVKMGRVVGVSSGAVTIEPAPAHRLSQLKPGDGVVFDAADWRSPEEREEGGRVYETREVGKDSIEVRFANQAIDFRRIHPGDLVWRTHDPEIDRIARRFTHASSPVARQRVHVRGIAREGEPLRLEWTLVSGERISVTVSSAKPLEAASNRPLDDALAREHLGRLGNTPYELAELSLDVAGRPFVPVSLLNGLRREAVSALLERQAAPWVRPHDPAGVLETVRFRAQRPARERAPGTSARTEPLLHVLVRAPEQLDAVLAARPSSVTLDYLDLYGLKPSVERVRTSGIEVRVASPRVLKPGEERIVGFLVKLEAPILVRSAGLLHMLRGDATPRLTGDFSLNVTNTIAAETFLALGLSRITPGHDLNAEQVAALARAVGPEAMEVVAVHHLPVFHTEHCVFARFLSKGTSFRDCGRPCERHRVALRDASGREHPVMADVGCRNTVFGAEAQEASRHLDAWRAAGIRHFRVELAHETRDETSNVLAAFGAWQRGECGAAELTRALERVAPGGTTEGSLFVAKGYLETPILG
jgi:putative protease